MIFPQFRYVNDKVSKITKGTVYTNIQNVLQDCQLYMKFNGKCLLPSCGHSKLSYGSVN